MNHPASFPKNTLIAAILFAALLLTVPRAMAQTPPAPQAEAKPAPAEAAPANKKMGTIEQHIADLRQQLAITPGQETE